jgi:hypothetical protein
VDVGDTLTGLGVGHAVIINRGVAVAVSVPVLVVDGKGVIKNMGEDVAVAVFVNVRVLLGVAVSVRVVLDVGVTAAVCDSEADTVLEPVIVGVNDGVRVRVSVGVGGSAVELTDATSLPTDMSTPHTWGRVSVAE